MPIENRASIDELSRAVERERKRASVRPLDISFNELADMYSTTELHITPEYQRTFRWSEVKQSQFIESIILEMPVPPIYTVEVGEAKWELIDGLQRLSTYLHFRGQLDLPDRDPKIIKGQDRLRLAGCDILTELNGYTFDDLSTTFQHRVRRATLRVEVVRKESNPKFAYYMFKRLNAGGEPLSDQEARNCSIRLLGTKFNDFIVRMTGDANFRKCTEDLTEEDRSRMEDAEMVLRFFAFKNNLGGYVHDIGPFLTDFMERVTEETSAHNIEFDQAKEEEIFKRTFKVLADTLGPKMARRWVGHGAGYGGGFSRSHYEAFAVGVARMIDRIPKRQSSAYLSKIGTALDEAKQDPKLKPLTTGGGKNFKRIYDQKIALVEAHLRGAI
jgi:hypothetical protein